MIGPGSDKNNSENITHSAISLVNPKSSQFPSQSKKQLDCFLQALLLPPVLYLLASWHFGLCSSPWVQF